MFYYVATAPSGPGLPLHDNTQTHHTWWGSSGQVIGSSQRNLPGNTHNTYKGQTSIPSAEFEPAIPKASGRRHTPQTARQPGSARIWNRTCSSLEYEKMSESVVKKKLCSLCFIMHSNSCQVVSTTSDITETPHYEGRHAMITVRKFRG